MTTVQSTAEWQPDQPNLVTFVLADAGGAELPGLGTAWSIDISVAGTPFSSGQGTKSEIGNGWYAYLTTVEEAASYQPGPRSLKITHPSTVQQNLEYFVVARDTGSRVIDYYVADSQSGQPIANVQCWITSDPADNANPFWIGNTDFSGQLLSSTGERPRVGAGTMYVWKYFSGYTDDQNPHTINTDTLSSFAGTMTAVPALMLPTEEAPGPVTPQYVFATPDDFMKYWFWDFGDEQHYEQLWPLLRMGASRVVAALASSDQLDCPKSDWANEYLRELNIIIAGVMFNSAAVRLSNEQRTIYNDYANQALENIRLGELQLCEGATGKGYPAFEVARFGLTERNTARIIAQDSVL